MVIMFKTLQFLSAVIMTMLKQKSLKPLVSFFYPFHNIHYFLAMLMSLLFFGQLIAAFVFGIVNSVANDKPTL